MTHRDHVDQGPAPAHESSGPAKWRLAVAAVLASVAIADAHPLHDVRSGIVLLVSSLAACAVLGIGRPISTGRLAFGAGTTAIAALLAIDPWMTPFPFVIALFTVGAPVRPGSHASCIPLCAALASMSFVLLIDASGLLWGLTSEGAWRLTSFVQSIAGVEESARQGLAYAPFVPLLLAAMCWCANAATEPWAMQRNTRALLVFGAGSFVALAFGQTLLAVLLAGLVTIGQTPSPQVRAASGWRTAVVAAIVIAGGPLALWRASAGTSSDEAPAAPTLAVLDVGMRSLDFPGLENLQETVTDANFASFLSLAQRDGWRVDLIDESMPEAQLARTDVLLVINLDRSLEPDALARVERFVESGGRALVLGDHTDIGGIMRPMNELLRATSIRLRFDSAIPDDSPGWQWRGGVRTSFAPAFVHRNNNALGISVGASIEAGLGSQPLVIADYGYGDWGNPDFGISRLGDMQYNVGERRGSLVLVAREGVGRGVYEVWGDTTGFQSGPIGATARARLSGLRDLVRSQPSSKVLISFSLGLAIVVFAAVLSPTWRYAAVVGIACGGTMVSLMTRATHTEDALAPQSEHGAVLVAYDNSHAPAFPQVDHATGLSALTDLVRRRGDHLITFDSFQQLLRSDPAVILLNEPAKNVSAAVRKALISRVEDGALLVVSAGPDGSTRLAELLEPLGASVRPGHLGVAHRARIQRDAIHVPQFSAQAPPSPSRGDQIDSEPAEFFTPYDAELGFRDAHALELDKRWSVLVSAWGHPLIAQTQLGDGRVVLIGDPQFLTKVNLETGSGYGARLDERNARFLLALLD
ncbi:MAG: DUF4350 domain-containing protein [Planctomycetota bacterium]